MTLETAIQLLADSAYRGMTTFGPDYKDAQKLAIEVLSFIQLARAISPTTIPSLFHGETPETSP